MRVPKDIADGLLKMEDKELWRYIVDIASKKGLDLPNNTPTPAQMQKIRDGIASPSINMTTAYKLANEIRRNK